PFMRSGGKILGFYANFELKPVSVHDIELLQGVVDLPWSGRIYYAGSERSVRALQRLQRTYLAGKNGRLGALLRIPATLVLVSPAALAANNADASPAEEASSQLPEHCPSITVDVTV